MVVADEVEERVRCLDFEVRDFPRDRQRLLDAMIKIRDEVKPDLVLLPSSHDTHQDHRTVHDEGIRAFKFVSMLGYEVPWNNLSFDTTSFVFLEEEDVAKKVEALRCYRSQSKRPYANEEFIRSLARTRGTQIGVSVLCPGAVRTGIWRSERIRPADLANTNTPTAADERSFLDGMTASIDAGVDASEIAPGVFDAVAARRFWILPDPSFLPLIQQRFDGILKGANPGVA